MIDIISNNNLTIVYEKQDLFDNDSYHNIYANFSFKSLTDLFSQNPAQKQDGYNVTNAEALQKMLEMKNALQAFLDSECPERIFDCLETTKAGKFHKTKQFTILRSGIIQTRIDANYASRYEICVRLVPVDIPDTSIKDLKGPVKVMSPDTCREMVICYAEVTKDTPPSIINIDGSVTVPNKPARTSYIKHKDLQPGTSYIDKTGKEWLYCGNLKMTPNRKSNNSNPDNDPVYFRITQKNKSLTETTSLEDFIANIVSQYVDDELVCINHDGSLTIYETTLKPLKSKKFVSIGTEYFKNTPINTQIHKFDHGIEFKFDN